MVRGPSGSDGPEILPPAEAGSSAAAPPVSTLTHVLVTSQLDYGHAASLEDDLEITMVQNAARYA